MAETADPRRRTFGPVVLVGLAAAALTAVAGHRQMLALPEGVLDATGLEGLAGAAGTTQEFPEVGALALVLLACWGVLLVARGGFRRVVAVLAALSVAGVLVALFYRGFVAVDEATEATLSDLGATTLVIESTTMHRTAWFWVALAGAALSAVATAAAVRFVPHWPEMGSKYDAPGAAGTTADEPTSTDLWKSLDEGQDPTA